VNTTSTASVKVEGNGDGVVAGRAPATGRATPGRTRIADHLAVLDAAVNQLPAHIAAGHRPGDDPRHRRPAGASAGRLRRLLDEGSPPGAEAATSALPWWHRSNRQIHAAISVAVDHEIYSRLALVDAQKEYQDVIERFPV